MIFNDQDGWQRHLITILCSSAALRNTTVNLILFEPEELGAAGEINVSGARADHLLDVLKVAAGTGVRVGIIDGSRGTGTVVAVEDRTVRLQCALDSATPPRPRVDLLLALPRPKVLRRLWAQLAALGVGRIMLTSAARVERNYFDTHVLSAHCYRPLLLEGLQQARDTRLPQVSIHRQLKVLIEDELDSLCPAGTRVLADPASTTPVHAAVAAQNQDRLLLAVGPEGGWTGFEISLLAAHGFQAAGMGPRTLRADTACVALLALVHAALETAPRRISG